MVLQNTAGVMQEKVARNQFVQKETNPIVIWKENLILIVDVNFI
jgi:hypothetical protein